jgi:hypothetical protein
MVWFLFVIEVLKTFLEDPKDAEKHFLSAYQVVEQLLKAEVESGFQIEKLLQWIRLAEAPGI